MSVLRSSSLVLFVLPLAACPGSSDKGGDPPGDTAPVTDTGEGPVIDDDAHIEIVNISASGPDCVGTSDHQDLDGLDFASYETYGLSTSPDPSPSYVVTARTSGPCQGETNERNPTGGDNPATFSTWTETWFANGGEGPDFLDCNIGCHPDSDNSGCNGTYQVTYTDVEEACEDYLPTKIFLDASSSSLIAKREMDGDANCSAGSGRFRLVAVQAGDVDNDGLNHYALFPVQESGTGVMTRSAWVTAIDQVSVPTGVTLRVIKSNQKFSFDLADGLKNASTVSSVVNASNDYSTGVIDGNPVFVVSELATSLVDDFQVDMEWSCSNTFTDTTSHQGYQFRLSDIGCTGDYIQKLTLRVASSPNRVSLEHYGTAAVSRTVPTQTTSEGKAFSYDKGNVSIDGVVLSNNAQQASVKINHVKWNGINLCDAGTYTFAAE